MKSQLAKQGFAVLKQAVPVSVCQQLREEGIYELQKANVNFVYNVKRKLPKFFQSSVRSPDFRHVLPCKLTESPSAQEALRYAAIAATTQCQLSSHLNLVELNHTVTLPGAQAQDAHSDISPTADQSLFTMWLALQDVTLDMGPTEIWLGSHILARDYLVDVMKWEMGEDAQNDRHNASSIVYNAEGEIEEQLLLDKRIDEDKKYTKFTENITRLGSDHMTLKAGDLAIMDCRAWHRGGGNHSQIDRYLFNMTFQGQEWNPFGDAVHRDHADNVATKELYGFTYDIHSTASSISTDKRKRKGFTGKEGEGWGTGLRMMDLMKNNNIV